MNETGYTQFHGIDCIFREDGSSITLIPSNPQDNILKYFTERNFFFEYKGIIYTRIAFVEKINSKMDHSLNLIPKYLFEFIKNFSICGFEIYGGAIDDFFNPINYFFPKVYNGALLGDVLYHKENADSWNVHFEDKNLLVTLSYGNVLLNGVGSDLKLHPKLNVKFDNNTDDIEFVYRVYSFITKFLQIIRYDLDFGHCTVELFDENGYCKGKFYDYGQHSHKFSSKIDLDYRYLKSYIGKLLQFSADNSSLSLNHLPCSTMRFNEDDYSPEILVTLFGAFENEYKLIKDIYGKADVSKIQKIKNDLILKIDELYSTRLTKEEKDFVNWAKSRINDIGIEFGQKKKIQKVYETLLPAFRSSINGIFYLLDKNTQVDIAEGKINLISSDLSNLRAKGAHGETFEKYTAIQAQEIRFLEILTYAQMLKRAGFDDIAIEFIIGVIFKCNFTYQNSEWSSLDDAND